MSRFLRAGFAARPGHLARPLPLVLWFVAALVVLGCAGRASGDESFPRVANYYFPSLAATDLEKLSKWDLVVHPCRAQDLEQEELVLLRELNPDIVLLAHTPAAYSNAQWLSPPILADILHKLDADNWWLRDTEGGIVTLPWFGDALMNQTIWCPADSAGDVLCDWLAEYIAERMPPGGLWDGVYLDCCWNDVYWLNSVLEHPIDANGDGIAETRLELDAAWRAGMERMVSRLRELVGPDYIIATNGNNTFYEQCNGSTRENFPYMHGNWYDNITNPQWGYVAIMSRYRDPATSVINSIWTGEVTDNGQPVRTPEFERNLRFTLTSTLVYGDGYYSLDGGAEELAHSQLWWHELYDIDLGMPLGRGELAPSDYGPWVLWGDLIRLRRFEHGVAVVNPTSCTQTIDLGGLYYRPESWNGSFFPWSAATTSVAVPARSGDILRGGGTGLEGASRFVYGAFSGRGVVLSWSPVPGARSYSVYRCHRPGSVASQVNLIDIVEGTDYFDATAGAEPLYYYAVAAIDSAGGEGQPSPEFVVQIPRGECVGLPGEAEASALGTSAGGKTESAPASGPGVVPRLGAHPNPVRDGTTFSFAVTASEAGDRLTLRVYDAGGRLVRTLADCSAVAGYRELAWDGRNDAGARLPAGCYLVALTAGSRTSTSKVTLVP